MSTERLAYLQGLAAGAGVGWSLAAVHFLIVILWGKK